MKKWVGDNREMEFKISAEGKKGPEGSEVENKPEQGPDLETLVERIIDSKLDAVVVKIVDAVAKHLRKSQAENTVTDTFRTYVNDHSWCEECGDAVVKGRTICDECEYEKELALNHANAQQLRSTHGVDAVHYGDDIEEHPVYVWCKCGSVKEEMGICDGCGRGPEVADLNEKILGC